MGILVRKTTMELCQIMGGKATKEVKKKAAKELEKKLARMIAGKPKGEKKKFLNAVKNLASENADHKKANQEILRTLTRGKQGQEFAQALDDYTNLTMPITANRATRSISKDLSESLSKSLSGIEILTPAQTSQIADDAIKAWRQEMVRKAKIMSTRVILSPYNKIKSLFVPSARRATLTKMTRLSRENFGTEYYNDLLSTKGLRERAPKGFTVTNKTANKTVEQMVFSPNGYNCQGGFNPIDNTIEFTKEFSDLPRRIQADFLAHELRHFEQVDEIIRTVGIDRYIQAHKTKALNALKASAEGVNEKELIAQVEKQFKEMGIEDKIREAFKASSKASVIDPNSELGKNALKNLEALETYTGIKTKGPFGIFNEISDDYIKNALEVEAYAVGRNAGKEVQTFEQLNFDYI